MLHPTLRRPTTILPLLLGASVTAPAQTTWTVNLDPAAGADFEQIQPALDVAVPGDVVLVGPGLYERFDLTEGVRLIGVEAPTGGASGTRVRSVSGGPSTVLGIPLEQVAVVADIDFFGPTYASLVIKSCEGTVVGDDLRAAVRVDDSVDVRLRALRGRAELVGATPWLEVGEPRSPFDPVYYRRWLTRSGPPNDSVRIHVSNPRAAGSDGYAECAGLSIYYIDGLEAISLNSGKVTVAGRAGDFLSGGMPSGPGCSYAFGAPAVDMWTGSIRHSGVDVRTGDPFRFPLDIVLGLSATEETPTTPDPSLRLVGRPTPGASISFEVDGAPGDWVRLELGRAPIVVPSNGSPVPRLVTPGRLSSLGPIPASGTTSLPARIPANAKAGDLYWFQASTVTPDGVGRRTNSLAVVVRP